MSFPQNQKKHDDNVAIDHEKGDENKTEVKPKRLRMKRPETELEAQIDEHIEKNDDGTSSCRVCGKNFGKVATNLRSHIETHIEGLSFSCQTCGKPFKTRDSLRNHKKRYHSDNIKSIKQDN